jgi:hypothetical protein
VAAGDLITADGQIEWGGVLLGSGTPYRWSGDDDALTGWEDTPGLDRGNVARPARHGSWAGRNYSQERIITWKSIVSTPVLADFGPAVTALRRATPIVDDDFDSPLVIRTKGGETHLVYGRINNRALPNNKYAGIGRGKATLQWTCADPLRYSVTEHSAAIPQPTAGSGLTYPLTYPLDYGTAGESGSRIVTNAGDARAFPTIAIAGPCATPSVTLVGSGLTIELDLAIAASETVLIDTNAGTVTLAGADRLFALTGRAVPPELFQLPPDADSEIAFRAATFYGGASATITWRDAYL